MFSSPLFCISCQVVSVVVKQGMLYWVLTNAVVHLLSHALNHDAPVVCMSYYYPRQPFFTSKIWSWARLVAVGSSAKAQASSAKGRWFESQLSQTNDLLNWYLSLHGAWHYKERRARTGQLSIRILWLSGKFGHGASDRGSTNKVFISNVHCHKSVLINMTVGVVRV